MHGLRPGKRQKGPGIESTRRPAGLPANLREAGPETRFPTVPTVTVPTVRRTPDVRRARPSLGKEDACRALQRKPFNGTQWVTNPIRQSWRPPEPSLGAAKLADVPMGVSPIDGDAQ